MNNTNGFCKFQNFPKSAEGGGGGGGGGGGEGGKNVLASKTKKADSVPEYSLITLAGKNIYVNQCH